MMPDEALQLAIVRRTGTVLLALLAATALVAVPAMAADEEAFENTRVVVEESTTGTFALTVPDGENVHLTVASVEDETSAEATVVDNGTGTVELHVDTGNASSDAFLSARGGTVTDLSVTGVDDGTLPTGEHRLNIDDETDWDARLFVAPTVAISEESHTLGGQQDQRITGTADIPAGETITARVTSSTGDPFMYSNTTTVESDGTFDVPLDLSDVSDEAPAKVTLYHDGMIVAETNATINGNDGERYEPHEPQSVVTFDTPADEFDIEGTDDVTVSGTADIPTGTNLTLRIRSSGAGAFIVTNQTTVDANSSFEGTLDLSHVGTDSEVVLQARHDGDVVGSAEGAVRATGNSDQRTKRTERVGDPPSDEKQNQLQDGITIAYDGDRLELEPQGNHTITGTAELDAGETVHVRLRSTDGTPFVLTEEGEVDRHGNFDVAVDMSSVDADPGTEFDVSAIAHTDSERLEASGSGIVVEQSDDDAAGQAMSLDTGDQSPLTSAGFGSVVVIVLAALLAVGGIGLLVRAGGVSRPY